MSTPEVEVIALSGGVGGAKLALGLQRTLPSGALAVVVNTGDDFEHLGLAISPDVDTTLYTLAGIADETRGWGRAGETWLAMTELERLGGATWFRLGDKDLALHLERTRRLAAGEPPSVITADFAKRLAVPSHIFPMTDDRVRTFVHTSAGVLAFQDYFVRRRCEPELRSVIIDGALTARGPAAALGLFETPSLKAVLICPSNPYLSIDPILALPCWTAALEIRTSAGRRCIAPRRRSCHQGSDNQDHGGTRHCAGPEVAGAALCGSHRWLGHRPRGRTLGAIVWRSRDGDFHHHEQPGRS